MKKLTIFLNRLLFKALLCIILFPVASNAQFNWSYTITANNHSILILSTVPVLINGNPISISDYIGVFYDSLGVPACGGYSEWQTGNNVVSAFGQDTSTVADDGFDIGEAFQWKVWQASSGQTFDLQVTYMTTMPNGGFYVVNGMSGLASVTNGVSAGITFQNISCTGMADGHAVALMLGSEAQSYLWSNGATTDSVSNLTAGTYTVTITDTLGIPYQASVTITEPLPISISSTMNQPSNSTAQDGSIQLVATGGTPLYFYLWSNGDTHSNLNNISVGIYLVTVTDSRGCTATAGFTLAAGSFSISGQVSGFNKSLQSCSVLLIEKDQLTFKAIDYKISSDGSYQFDNVEPSQYMVFAIPKPGSPELFFPAYYGNSLFWGNCTQINLSSNQTDINITLGNNTASFTGFSKITGIVNYLSTDDYETGIYDNNWFGLKSTKDIHDVIPARNMPVLLLDMSYNPLSYSLTNAQGNFEFDNLQNGDYLVYVEKAGFITYPVYISISGENGLLINVDATIDQGAIEGTANILGIDEATFSDKSIYPNPVKDMLYISAGNALANNMRIKIYNSSGEEVTDSWQNIQVKGKISIDVSRLQSGMYLFTVTGEEKSFTGKFIRQ